MIVNKGLAALPVSTGANAIALTPTILSGPASPAATFALLQSSVTAGGATIGVPPALAIPRIRKSLPPSYLAVGGGPPDGNLTTSDDEFGCAVRGNPAVPIPTTPLKTLSWGQVISYALRQPILALKLGLIYRLTITLTASEADAFDAGGYVPRLARAIHGRSPARRSPARSAHPRLPSFPAAPRSLFASLEFPVYGAGGAPSDSAFHLADVYADGFAKLVHCTQPANSAAAVGDGQLAPGSDLGIELGWDDEQVVQWHNDQLALLNARTGGTLGSATRRRSAFKAIASTPLT